MSSHLIQGCVAAEEIAGLGECASMIGLED